MRRSYLRQTQSTCCPGKTSAVQVRLLDRPGAFKHLRGLIDAQVLLPWLLCVGQARYLVAVGACFALYIDVDGTDTLFMLAHQQ